MMHRRDLAAFKKYCDVVYFPSQECTKVLADVKFKEIGILPPGCNEPKGGVKLGAREIFYAGGVREADGMDDLLIALDRINKSGLDVKLNLITKKEELDRGNGSFGRGARTYICKMRPRNTAKKKTFLYGYGNIGKGSRVHEPRTTHDIH